MTRDMEWQRREAEARIHEVLDAAKARGAQRILDTDGSYDITFVPKKRSLEELFSRPGPFPDDEDLNV